jgi:hypothetical protein
MRITRAACQAAPTIRSERARPYLYRGKKDTYFRLHGNN